MDIISIILLSIAFTSLLVYIVFFIYEKNDHKYKYNNNFIMNFQSKDEDWNADIPISRKITIAQYKDKNGEWSDPKLLYWSGEKWHQFNLYVNIDKDKAFKKPDRWLEVESASFDMKK